jgi:hypothetical protein
MTIKLKDRLRTRMLGQRFRQAILDGHSTVGKLGNQDYFYNHPGLIAPQHQPDLNAYEFSLYSQNGEDGLILYLLSRIGVTNHYVVEVGIEDGRQCNSANLTRSFGWRACLIEASDSWHTKAEAYLVQSGQSERISLLHATAKPDNIHDLLSSANLPAQIDVLSIDIDSNDYWLWRAIDWTSPRLVIIEYNASFGPDRSVTVPYIDDWKVISKYYHGASLTALARLGRQKGYILAGCDSKGVNALFVRADLAFAAGIHPQTPVQAYFPHFSRTRQLSVEEQSRVTMNLPLVEIDEN